MKSGTVALIGRSNVGKSTLLNRLLGEKVSIVSNKPQTTRRRILGVVHRPDVQIGILDTPGLHEPTHRLNKRMIRTAIETLDDADILYLVTDAVGGSPSRDRGVIREVQRAVTRQARPVVLVINKADAVPKPTILPLLASFDRVFPWHAMVPVSAQKGDNVDRLIEVTIGVLPNDEPLYPEDTLTDQSMRALAADLIREHVLHKTYQEVPHAVAVEIDEFKEEGKLARIAATILVERESQKAIVIGEGGARLKEVGSRARLEMERMFGMKVFLRLWVKVREAWREDEQALVELGY
ncbi:MAG: GTPase Era [Nitrospiraceae bacterium]